jgi:hypothetical protein
MSFDAEDDLDADLAAELSRRQAPDAWRKLQRQLEMAWDIRKVVAAREGCARSQALCARRQVFSPAT